MPSAVLDAPRAVPAVRAAVPAERPRRLPVPVLAAAALAVLESLGLLALSLTGLDGVFGTGIHPSGPLVAVSLLVVAGWVVLCAGGGASLVDGAGRTLLVAVAAGEIALLLVLALAGLLGADGVWVVVLGPLGGLPVPALALVGLGVPTGKLLLAGAPSAQAWVAAGGRPRAPRSAPVAEHRALRGLTLACIGLALTGVAVLGGPAGPAAPPATATVAGTP